MLIVYLCSEGRLVTDYLLGQTLKHVFPGNYTVCLCPSALEKWLRLDIWSVIETWHSHLISKKFFTVGLVQVVSLHIPTARQVMSKPEVEKVLRSYMYKCLCVES